jgi:hypothetical protein
MVKKRWEGNKGIRGKQSKVAGYDKNNPFIIILAGKI